MNAELGADVSVDVKRGPRAVVGGILFVAIPFAVGALGSLATIDNVNGWYALADKAFWTPPNWVFGPVWSVLYVLMGVAAWFVWREPNTRPRRIALTLFIAQLVLNAVWTPVFFAGFPLWGASAFWEGAVIIMVMDLLVLATMAAFSRARLLAAVLLIPYWVWILYATTLNVYLAANNA